VQGGSTTPSGDDGQPDLRLTFDRGEADRHGQERQFTSAEVCSSRTPCTVNQFGALRFMPLATGYETEIFYFRENVLLPILLFERRGDQSRNLFWTATHRARNAGIKDFDGLMRAPSGQAPEILYLYGINLQYSLHNGDVLYVRLRAPGEVEPRRYYFRYHVTGLQVQPNLTSLVPLSYGASEVLQPRMAASSVSFAGSVSIYWNLPPDGADRPVESLLSGFQPTLLVGALSELRYEEGYNRTHSDLFVGGGLTFARFLSVGYCATLLEAPRGGFPFIGVHVNELLVFFSDLGNRNRKWQNFKQQEQGVAGTAAPAGPGGGSTRVESIQRVEGPHAAP
jgi:hypothetical protein